jgi:hypothetical protein
MTVVCAGEFVKEVVSLEYDLKVDEYQEFIDQDSDVHCPTIGIESSDCICCGSVFKNELVRFTRI